MKRRYRSVEERQQVEENFRSWFQQEVQRSSMSTSLGRTLFFNYARVSGVSVTRDMAHRTYMSVFPDQTFYRLMRGKERIRRNFWSPGPNVLWSLDGYAKLSPYGFQVYACIDAYSRKIIWFYIGRSATTALSCMKQFLQVIKANGYRPFYTRCDGGSETPLWAAAQFLLASSDPVTKTIRHPINTREIVLTQGDRLDSCHLFGTSTANVRIESWWRILTNGASERWISYFGFLVSIGLLVSDNPVHLIALYAIYGPILRHEFSAFVLTWNRHRIRSQPNRPHISPGVPNELFANPERDCGDWKVEIPEDSVAGR